MIQVLDCTLRDGGYVNNWEFGKGAMLAILEKLNGAGVDIVECGFLTGRPRGEGCSLFGSPRQIARLLPQRDRRAMFVAMIALGEDELSPERLPFREEGDIEGIRLTFHREDTDRALRWAREIGERGYQVFVQPVGTAFYTDLELLRLVEKVNRLRPFAFYIVDTLGSMYRSQLARQFHLIDGNMDSGIRLGFHGHNNLQLAFSNAQALASLETKRDVILDASVYGMGRGAGNLPTELITRYINRNIQSRYDAALVMDVYDEYIALLRREYEWGYSMAYHIAAVHGCHPNYAAYLLNRQTLTTQDIEKILRMIPRERRVEFDRDLAGQLYARFQSRSIDDTRAVEELSGLMGGRTPLVLAPGPSLRAREREILEYIRRERPFVAAVNFSDPRFSVEACFVSNHKKLDILGREIRDQEGARLVLTSNLGAFAGADCLWVDYDRCLSGDPMVADDAGLMCLRLLGRCGAKEAVLAGFDGFLQPGSPYYRREGALPVNPAEACERQRRMKEQLQKLPLGLRFLTPSAYGPDRPCGV